MCTPPPDTTIIGFSFSFTDLFQNIVFGVVAEMICFPIIFNDMYI